MAKIPALSIMVTLSLVLMGTAGPGPDCAHVIEALTHPITFVPTR